MSQHPRLPRKVLPPHGVPLVAAITATLTILTTPLPAATFTSDFASDPGGIPLGIAEVEDGVLKLTDLADLPPADPAKPLPQNGSYILPDFNNGAAIQSFTAQFKAAVGGGSALGAQGFSFVLAPDLGTEVFREGGGTTRGLTISFDTIDNLAGFNAEGNDPGDAPGIIVKVAGAKVAAQPFRGIQTFPPNSTATRFANVEVRVDADGTLDVTYDGTKVIDNLGIGYTPIAGQFGWGAGTAELTAAIRNNHWIDDVDITTTTVGSTAFVSAKSPAAQNAPPDAVVSITVENLASTTVQMTFDGSAVTPNVSSSGNTRTITYDPPGFLPAGSTHRVVLTYDTSRTFAFDFTVADYITIPASAKARQGSVNTASSGFKARAHQVTSPAPSSVTTAIRQLNGLSGDNLADLSQATAGTFDLTTVNWDDDQFGAGHFPVDDPIPGYPGFDPDGNNIFDNFVVEAVTYLDLPAGVVTLGVRSDDGFGVFVGGDPRDATNPLVGHFNGVADHTFSFLVEEAGIYGVRLVWYEAAGDAHCEFFSIDAAGNRILVNDRNTPGHIRAYRDRVGNAAPYVSSVSPAPGETGVAAQLDVQIVITEENTTVNADSIRLTVHDAPLTPVITKAGKLTTVRYQHPGNIPANTYDISLAFTDSAGNAVSGAWSFSTSPGPCDTTGGQPSPGNSGVSAHWEFNGNLAARTGSAAEFIDPSLSGHYTFGTSGQGEFADVPGIDGQPVQFLAIPRNDNGEDFRRTGLRIKPGIPANGGGNNANVWTLVMDLYWGEGHGFGTVFRTHDLDQNNDADLFWRASDGSYGKGCCSNYDGINPANSHQRHAWARVVFVTDMSANPKRFAKYINGVKHREDPSGDGANVDGRYSLPPEILMFNDGDDNEQSTVLVNSMQFRPVALSDAEVAALGGPSAAGIPEPNTLSPTIKGHWDFSDSLQATVGSAATFIDNSLASHYSFGTSGQGDHADIPGINGQPVRFLSIPRNDNGEDFRRTGLRIKPGIPANGGGNNANVWTLVMDLYWGEGHGFGTVFRTHDLDQNNDADLFWRASDGSYGKGCCSNYDGINPANSHQRHAWARVVFVTDMSANPKRFAKYINGVKHREDPSGDGANVDGRYSLPPEILMFNDGDDNEQSSAYVSAIQFRNVALSDAEVAALGGPTPDGPPLTGGGAGTCLPLAGSAPGVELHGAATVNGPYTLESGAVLNEPVRTITVPRSGNARFYRIRGSTQISIRSISLQGTNLIIGY